MHLHEIPDKRNDQQRCSPRRETAEILLLSAVGEVRPKFKITSNYLFIHEIKNLDIRDIECPRTPPNAVLWFYRPRDRAVVQGEKLAQDMNLSLIK